MQYVYYNTMEENNKEHTNIQYTSYMYCIYNQVNRGIYIYTTIVPLWVRAGIFSYPKRLQ